MKTYNYIEVYTENTKVGTLALLKQSEKVAFAYTDEWIASGFSVNPLSLPLKKGVFVPKTDLLEGLFGAFADSLPDGWGRLLVDRVLMKEGIQPENVSSLNRLAIVGESGMGSLEYRPVLSLMTSIEYMEYDQMARECQKILENQNSKKLDTLFRMGGSSGGARPKVFVKHHGEDWIVKFKSSVDHRNIGIQEFDYMNCARKCGIRTPEFELFDSKYFGVKRFDRNNGKKIYMISASGLLETSHRTPNLDYNILMKLTLRLTKSYDEILELYRRMCFNVFAHNRDDHSKNFSYLYDRESKKWILSPVYDLTYSYSINGEHATTINGNGKNPSEVDLYEVANKIGLKEQDIKKITKDIKEIVYSDLKKYL